MSRLSHIFHLGVRMKKLFGSKLQYRNRWFPALLILIMVLSSIGTLYLFFESKFVFLLFSPAINVFGIWLVVKKYRLLNLFLNIWLIIISLNLGIQVLNLMLGVEITDTIPLLLLKCFFVILVFFLKKYSLILQETTTQSTALS